MTRKELLREVKKRYPVGTIYIPINNSQKTIISKDHYYHQKSGVFDDYTIKNTEYILYNYGTWAEVIFRPKTELEEALEIIYKD